MKHPAKFSAPIMAVIREILDDLDFKGTILDPFAGAGGIHELNDWDNGVATFGLELEPEWAALHERTEVADATKNPWPQAFFDAVITSPCYGNRMADNDPRDSVVTYRSKLGRPLSEGNAGGMQWGKEYRLLHAHAWYQVKRVLVPGGLFILNISDHVRNGKRQKVTAWHLQHLQRVLDFDVVDVVPVSTRRMKHGANAEARVDAELVVVLRAP